GTEVNINVVGDVIANASTIINNSEFKTELTNVIKTDETLTTLENKGSGLYTYTNEKGVEVDINVVGDVIGNASTIFNNAEVTNFIKEISEQTAGSVTYNSETKQFSYVDVAGNTQVVNISDVIKGSETVTTLENKGEGLYTYKNEEGTEVNIDVVGDVVANASTIINNSEFKTELTNVIKTDETLTTLESKGEGVYVYTNEKGTAVTIDVLGDVIGNASTIFNNAEVTNFIKEISEQTAGSVTYNSETKQFSYVDVAGNTQVVNISDVIKGSETVTTLENKGEGLYTYKNEEGTEVNIDVVGDVVANASTIINNSEFKTELTNVIKTDETLTTLENKGEGLYTYTNEKGVEVDINVVGDVVANASTIFNNAEVTNFIKEISEQTAGSVTYNSETKQFSYVDVAGNTQVVNIADVIKGSETVTTLENKGEGLYTYKNEEGTEVNIDVVGDVVANASTIINNSEFKTELTNVIKTDETLTTLENKGEGLYTYTNEKGVEVDINVVGDVIGNASTIFNNAEVTNFIKEISEQTAGSVTYNSETKQFSYVDVAGNTQVVNIADVIKGSETVTTLENKGEGLYTYKNEEGTEVNIDVVGDVVANASTIINNSEFKTELTNVIKTDETLTTLENKGEGLYTYTNEKGVEVDINVVGDVVANASTIFNNAEVTNFIKEISEQTVGSVTYNSETKQFSYVDVAGNTQVVNIADVIKGSETVTTLTNNGSGSYTYVNEAGAPSDINVVSDVISNASTIFNNTDVVNELTKIVDSKETVTTLVHNTTAKTLVYNGEGEQSTTINLADITTSTPDTVLAVSGTGSTFTAATVNVVPSTVVGDVITTTAEGVVGWKAAAKNNVMGIKVISADYTVGNDDYTIIARKLTQDITITLPDAKTNTGRLLVINQYNVIIPNTNPDIQVPVKVNFNTDVVYSDAASYPYMTASMFGGVTNGSIKMTLQSDGENWYVITYTM
ncbi:hypothetical protein, partial [Flavobacterium pectinovorum]